ncbi:MAG: ArsR/SmtB family transcription factor [Candidatus Helarchaeota archaeon]
MMIIKVLKALSSKTRLRIINLLTSKELSAIEIYRLYIMKYNERISRESIYKATEKLVNANLITKNYDRKNKKIVYKLNFEKLEIDFKTLKINLK